MTLTLVLVSISAAGIFGLLARGRVGQWRRWRLPALLVLSVIAVYVLQPALPIRGLDFWLPTCTLILTALTWIVTAPPEARSWKANRAAAVILAGLVLALGLTRHLGFSLPLTASRPPQTAQIAVALAAAGLAAILLARFAGAAKAVLGLAFFLVLLLFACLKVPALALLVSSGLRSLQGQATATASAYDLRWLGFSYIAFRLLHTIRDRQSGRLPAVSLGEYVIYVIFFPALAAGPIDRIERFLGDLRRPPAPAAGDLGDAGLRLILGLFKKFALADSLALIALNGTNALQVRSAGWSWILLYAYALQIYFDFSGYTDIAIGTGRLLGIRLPENFRSPYLKPNLTQFWNNWHMTLTQWFRAYFFNPITRSLRTWKRPLPAPVTILLTQVATMLLIGLWHGVTWSFVLWGLWHGIGLFVHNRWSELTRARFAALSPAWQGTLNAGGALLTFHFTALGWVFFALPGPEISLRFLKVLFAIG